MPPKKAQTAAAKKAATSAKATATKKAKAATTTPSTAAAKAINGTKRASSRAAKPATTAAPTPAPKAAPAKTAGRPKSVASTIASKAKPGRKPAAAKKIAAPPAKPAKKAVAPKPVTGKRKAAEDSEDAPKAKKAKTSKAVEAPPRKIAKPRGRPAKADADAAKAMKPTAKKAPAPKKAVAPKKAPAPKKAAAPKPPKRVRLLPDINTVPTQVLDIYVFGEGSAGELGLGAKSADGKKVVDVTRPRLNPRLAADSVGVVQIAVGGMHCAALTKDNKILTWGVNDQGALGRTTAQEGKMKDIGEEDDSDSDSDDDDSGLNPSEAEPREVDMTHFAEGTKIASLYAGDSSTYAVTTTGQVYGWGTFRGNDGILGFRQGINTQWTPMLIPELKNIVKLAIGTNHVLALDNKGKVFAWGAGEQNQLGRRVVSRTATGALTPREFGLQRKKIVDIGCGDYHNFAVQDNGNVHAWGLNTFGQTGVEKKGEDDDTVLTPTIVKAFKDYDIKQITGGAHHSIACTKDGDVLTIGKADTNQSGVKFEDIPKEYLYVDEQGRPRYLSKPLVVPNIKGVYVATATDTSIVVDAEGKAHSWGFSGNYQTGQGSDEDFRQATWIDNTAVRGKKLVVAGVGGQFGVLGGVAGESVAA